MGSKQNIIELNGNRYDARTGQPITTQKKPQTAAKAVKKPAPKPGVVDGFVRRKKAPAATTTKQRSTTAARAVHAKQTRSKTLMRTAVKKPAKQKVATIEAKKTHHLTEAQRAERAKQIARSQHISKFGSALPSIARTVEPIAVRETPAESARIHAEPPVILPEHTLTLNPFENALKKSTSHLEPKAKKTKRRHKVAKKLKVSPKAVNIGASVLVALIVGGFIAYRSMPSMAVRVAAARAGVNATLPGYQPAGFSLAGPVQYADGQITLGYKSNSDNRSFKVVQKKTDWTSQTLLNNFITAADKQYQTYQEKGKTIYIYDGSNATWVSGGVWYQVEGSSALNSDQLLRIASSL